MKEVEETQILSFDFKKTNLFANGLVDSDEITSIFSCFSCGEFLDASGNRIAWECVVDFEKKIIFTQKPASTHECREGDYWFLLWIDGRYQFFHWNNGFHDHFPRRLDMPKNWDFKLLLDLACRAYMNEPVRWYESKKYEISDVPAKFKPKEFRESLVILWLLLFAACVVYFEYLKSR